MNSLPGRVCKIAEPHVQLNRGSPHYEALLIHRML